MKSRAQARRRGVTTLVVLMLMTVMLLGGLAMARIVESSVLVGGNVATREASIHASEIGWNTAYTAVKALANENADAGGWYWATMIAADADGIPNVNWAATPTVSVGRYTVTYAVERMCTVAILTASSRECLVKSSAPPENRDFDPPDHIPKNSRQFRITVRVTDARGTQTWVQSLVTKGG
jgi:Tfp pilus assembly protein PilX